MNSPIRNVKTVLKRDGLCTLPAFNLVTSYWNRDIIPTVYFSYIPGTQVLCKFQCYALEKEKTIFG